MKTLIAVCIVIAAGIGCSDSTVNYGKAPFGEIIFETESVNFAWGVMWRGAYIDINGKVHTFDRSNDTIMWREDNSGMFTEAELTAKYSRRDTIRSVVTADSLLRMKQLAQTIDPKKYSDTVSAGADMGAWTTAIYIFDSAVTKYRRIILSQDGDRRFVNTSANAKEISYWLKRIR